MQSNTSCTQRTRRNARFETNCVITPGFVSTPAVTGGLFVQFADVIVVPEIVGQVPVVAVNKRSAELLLTVSCVANAGTASSVAVPPMRNVLRQNASICVWNRGSASIAVIICS